MNCELEIIRNIVAEVLQTDAESIPLDASFRNDLFIYTSEIKAILLYTESEFDVRIPPELAADIDSIREIGFAVRNSGKRAQKA